MKRFQSILCASFITLAISSTVFAGDIPTGKATSGDIPTGKATSGIIPTGKSSARDLTDYVLLVISLVR